MSYLLGVAILAVVIYGIFYWTYGTLDENKQKEIEKSRREAEAKKL